MKILVDTASVKIPAKPEFVGVARLVTAAYSSLLGFDREAAEDIKIAVSEACTNAILQLHKEAQTKKEADKMVEIVAYSIEDSLIVDVIYASTDRSSMKTAHAQLADRDLGLSLLTSIVDKVEIIHAKNHDIVLRLAKKIPI